MKSSTYGLEQARAQLPHIASEALAGETSVITRHGRPIAVVIPVAQWQAQQAALRGPGILALRGAARGMWGRDSSKMVAKLRDEWDK